MPITLRLSQHLPNVPMISSELQVRVSDGRGGVEGAYVCAWKENEVHEVGRTGADGLAILNVAPTSVGEMLITVSGLNIYPQQSVVNVAPAGCRIIVMNKRYYNCAGPKSLWRFTIQISTSIPDRSKR